MKATFTYDTAVDTYRNGMTDSARKARDKQSLIQQITIIGMYCSGSDIVSWEPVTARFYMSPHADGTGIISCILWTPKGVSSGIAKGYGYHKQSAALEEACRKACIELSEDIHGRGERAMEEALVAIAKACSDCATQWHICKAHN